VAPPDTPRPRPSIESGPRPRKRPRQARARATVTAILDATEQQLVAHGYDGTNTNNIARRAGVSVGTLYQYFPNKEAVVLAVAERHAERLADLLVQHLTRAQDASLPDACAAFVRALLQAHALAPELHSLLIEQVPRIAGTSPLRSYDEMFEAQVRAFLVERRAEIDPPDLDLAVFILVHAVQAVTHAAVLMRPDALADEALAEAVTALILRFLRAG